MNKIKAAGDTKENVLSDKIKTLRAYRDRFRVDPPFHALRQEIEFHQRIDPIHQIQLGLGNSAKFYPRLFEADAAKVDPVERRREITEIFLFRLLYDDFDQDRLLELGEQYRNGTFRLSPAENAQLRKQHQRGAKQLFEDGYTPRERRDVKRTVPGFNFKANPKISHETMAFNKSLNPIQHHNNHVNRMQILAANPSGAKRPRTAIKTDIETVMRGRKHWRVPHIFKACAVMDDLIAHLSTAIPDSKDRTIEELKRTYRFADLIASDSSRISSSLYAQLAAAITSADHLADGTDDYAANNSLAINVMRHYGLYEKAKRSAKKISSQSNDLILKNFQRFYSGAI